MDPNLLKEMFAFFAKIAVVMALTVMVIVLDYWIQTRPSRKKDIWAPCPNCGHLPKNKRGCPVCNGLGPEPGRLGVPKEEESS